MAGTGTAGSKQRRASVLALIGALVLALVVVLGSSVNADAKKKKSKANVFSATKTVNAPIPDAVNNQVSTPVLSTITVPKKFKGKVVGDVNVTGIQTTGNDPGAGAELIAKLTAPNGRTIPLFRLIGGPIQSIGPWTLDDDTKTSICPQSPASTCPNPNQSLYPPFAGTSNLVWNNGPALTPLAGFNGVPMRGSWTFRIEDVVPPGPANTSVLNQWGLKITAAKPVSG